jgi:hypothetical protein
VSGLKSSECGSFRSERSRPDKIGPQGLPHPLGDLAAKARRPRATGKKDGRKTLTLEQDPARLCPAAVDQRTTTHRSPREVLPLTAGDWRLFGAPARFKLMEC